MVGLKYHSCVDVKCGNLEMVDRQHPDEDWCANTLVKLSRGVTAYRLDKPVIEDAQTDYVPLVVLLHDLYEASYIFKDLVALLTHITAGAPNRVLSYDYYGRGRSPWCEGVNCTMEVYVCQLKDLLESLSLYEEGYPIILNGKGLGGAIAAGFASRYPNIVQSICLLNPMGISVSYDSTHEGFISNFPFWNYCLWERSMRHSVTELVHMNYHQLAIDSKHNYLINKDIQMMIWQSQYTPGYYQSIYSTLLYFPIREKMIEIYNALGGNPCLSTLILLGKKDKSCEYEHCLPVLETAFPRATMVSIDNVGHNVQVEGFDVVAAEVLGRCKHESQKILKQKRGY